MPDGPLVTEIADSARSENIACARRLAAVAELHRRRCTPVEDGQGRELWRIDPWEAVAAEVAAALTITAAAAGALLHNATCLHERLPRIAELFAAGAVDYRTVRMLVARTLLALEPEVLAAIDAELAEAIPGWGALSVNKMQQAIDRVVGRHDPQARRRAESRSRGRHVDIVHERDVSYLSGQLFQTDATLLDRRLTALGHSVCDKDPRTVEQRRADALGALAVGATTLACACGEPDCPAADDGEAAPSVVVHVVAEAAAVNAAAPEVLHGENDDDHTAEIITSPERLAEIISAVSRRCGPAPSPAPSPVPSPVPRSETPSGVVLGGQAISPAVIADLVARGMARLRPVVHPGDSPPEPRYRPSAALADFVRCRDMTCRFPGCDVPADHCDLDHTVPYEAGGPTHASNIKAECRKHHLIKTFWCGPGGWRDQQFPDGTVIWTSPSGHTYRTVPGSALLVPALCVPTPALKLPDLPDYRPERGAMMPRRLRTREEDRRRRILAERRRNLTATWRP